MLVKLDILHRKDKDLTVISFSINNSRPIVKILDFSSDGYNENRTDQFLTEAIMGFIGSHLDSPEGIVFKSDFTYVLNEIAQGHIDKIFTDYKDDTYEKFMLTMAGYGCTFNDLDSEERDILRHHIDYLFNNRFY